MTKNNQMIKKVILFAVILLNSYTASAQSATIKVEGIKRKYIIYLPKGYQADQTYPLVLNFHGGGMTAAEQMFYTRMNQAADRYKFIVVYPAGIKNDWNVGFETSYRNGTDDVGFIKGLTDSLKQKFHIDQKAVFATGLSRGGFFCHRLAAELPLDFAAIASVGGPLPDSVRYYHRFPKSISVMQVHGNEDQVVSYTGEKGSYASAQATFGYWLDANRLTGKIIKARSINADKKDGTAVVVKEVEDTKAAVTLVTVINGGHTWPGSDAFNIGYPLGKTTNDIDMNEMIWKFFSKHKKK